MKLNALVMCRNQHSLRLLGAVLDEVGIEQEASVSAPETLELLVRGHYSALVLDFDVPSAATVARIARVMTPDRRPVVFAVIGALTAIRGAFEAGANFVLYKPLVPEQVERSLRAARGFMRSDRRRSPRQKLGTIAYLGFNGSVVPAVVQDVNEKGISLQTTGPLPAAPEVPFHFLLPGVSQAVDGTGELIWADDLGRAGMSFAHLTPASRKHLKTWLGKRNGKRKAGSRSPEHGERHLAAVH